MRGDYIEVTFKTGAGTDKIRVQARTVGSSVEASGFDAREPFIAVEELDKNHEPIRTARFAKHEVVAIDQGHSNLVVKK